MIAINVSHLRLDDVEGRVAETIAVATMLPTVPGPVAAAKYRPLVANNSGSAAG